MPHRPCIEENTLGDLVEGRLDEGARHALEAHLGDCAACRRLVSGAQNAHAQPDPVDADVERLTPGVRVGRYIVVEPIGAGAMGTVYAAHDPDLDRRIALKLLRARVATDELRARLLREAKAMARLSHPDVITVYDVGVYGTQLFVAMELVAGGTLREWLASKPRDWREILAVFRRAGQGLACAHAAGLVHRDFKPDNVLVGTDGRVRVTDFGLARTMEDGEHVATLSEWLAQDALDATIPPRADSTRAFSPFASITRTGALVGTPAYMAPEQLRGVPADARSDMFSFGVALYEALYGQRPFEGNSIVALRTATVAGAVRAAPKGSPVPPHVRSAVLTALRPEPGERYASMEALLEALGDGPAEDTAMPRRRGLRAPVLIATLAALATIAVGAVVLFGSASAPRGGIETVLARTEAPARPAPQTLSSPLKKAVIGGEDKVAAAPAPTAATTATTATTTRRIHVPKAAPPAAPRATDELALSTAPAPLSEPDVAPKRPVAQASAAPAPEPRHSNTTKEPLGGAATYDRE